MAGEQNLPIQLHPVFGYGSVYELIHGFVESFFRIELTV